MFWVNVASIEAMLKGRGKSLALFALYLVSSCSDNSTIYIPQHNNYINSNIFKFHTEVRDNTDSLIFQDTLLLKTMGRVWSMDAQQFEIGWKYPWDVRTFSTGVVVKADSIWLHSPRHGIFQILEGSAFPCIKTACLPGDSWSHSIMVPVKSWFYLYPEVTSRTNNESIRVDNFYTCEAIQSKTFGSTTSKYVIIKAESSSPLGKSNSEFHYSRDYGFIYMEHNTIIGSRITLELIAINNIPKTH